MRGRWLDALLVALPLPLKGALLILIGMVMLFLGWIDLKGGRGLMHVAVLTLLGLFCLACGVALLIVPSGAAT